MHISNPKGPVIIAIMALNSLFRYFRKTATPPAHERRQYSRKEIVEDFLLPILLFWELFEVDVAQPMFPYLLVR